MRTKLLALAFVVTPPATAQALPELQAGRVRQGGTLSLSTRGRAPRQTPMLAGRVAHDGPYGWRGESPTAAHRIEHGFGVHRWFAWRADLPPTREARARAAYAASLRSPPLEHRERTLEELRHRPEG